MVVLLYLICRADAGAPTKESGRRYERLPSTGRLGSSGAGAYDAAGKAPQPRPSRLPAH